MKTPQATNYTGTGVTSQIGAPQEQKSSVSASKGVMNGHSYKKGPKSDFQRIKSLVNSFIKTVENISGIKFSSGGIKASKKVTRGNSELQKINTLRINSLIKRTDRFVKGDQSSMASTLKHRKPGEGIQALIEKNRTPSDPAVSDKGTTERDAVKQESLKSAEKVRKALTDAHTIMHAAKELKRLQKSAIKNPGSVSQDDLQKIQSRLKELQPLAMQMKQALSSPQYRGLFARLFIP